MLAHLLFAALVTAAVIAPDPAARGPTAVEDPPILPLSSVAPGQKGTGYTVFSSLRGAEPFQFEVLGVMENFLGPGEHLIIARLFGGEIEKTGVIAGMSGSPAYVDGKLIGAVGYRFGNFTKDPIAGITPIERMMVAAPLPAKPAKRASSAWGQAEPIAVPVTVAGVPTHVLDAFRPLLDARGFGTVVQGGAALGAASPAAAASASRPSKTPVRFFAGGPISGNLVDGDVSIAATGTVTWVKGDRFLAFGHPFLGEGKSEMPVGNAHIVTTVASEAGSWKMGQATNTFARLTDDRLHAIAGTMGAVPPRVHVELELDAESPRAAADAKTRYAFEVIQHETDTPLFIAIAIASALGNRVGVERGGTVDLELEARLSNGQVLPVKFRASDVGMGYDLPVAFAALGALASVTEQDFEKVQIASVKARVKATSAIERVRLVGVDAPRALVAGEEAEVRVRTASFRSPRIDEMRTRVRVPRGLPPGSYSLVAAGASEAMRVEREIGVRKTPLSFARYLDNLKAAPLPGTLSLYLVRDEVSMRIQGETLVGLPASLEGLLSEGGGLSGQVVEASGVMLARSDRRGVLVGEVQARVLVRSQDERTGE